MSLTSRLLIKSMFIPVQTINEESLKESLKTPSIIIANHSSAADIPLLDGLMYNAPRFWIGNQKYKRVIPLGILLHRMNVAIAPAKPKQAIRALEQAEKKAFQTKQHILMFPEGTRYPDGSIHQFKSGFARLAQNLNRPIIPVLITHINEIFPRSAYLIHRPSRPVTMLIGQPMQHHAEETNKDFIDRIERWFKLNKEKL